MKRANIWGAATLLILAIAGSAQAGVVERLKLGESKVLTNYIAGNCDGPAPSFSAIQRYLPDSDIVIYSDGGVSQVESKRCGGEIASRQIVATGVRPGTEIKNFQAGRMGVRVY